MKKAFSLLLVLTMLTVAGLAGSEALEVRIGRPSACSLETFKYNFDTRQNDTGHVFSWNEKAGTYNDYQVYSGSSEDGMTAAMIYTMNGGVALATVIGKLTLDYSDPAYAEKLSTWLSTAISSMTFGLYIGDNSAESVDISVLSDRFSKDLLPLVSDMAAGMSDEKKLREGFACSAACLCNGLQLPAPYGICG